MFSKALLVFPLISVAFAMPFITTPVHTTTYTGGQKDAVVTWMEDPSVTGPTSSDFGLSSISIYVGNAQQQTFLQSLNPSVDVSKTLTITFTPDPTIGPDGSDYFIRMQSLAGKDNTTLKNPFQAFSSKFTLKGMSGTFNSSVISEIAGQSTAPLGPQTSSGASSSATSSPALTATGTSKSSTGTSSTTSATAKPSSGAMDLKAGWVGIVFGAVVGVTLF